MENITSILLEFFVVVVGGWGWVFFPTPPPTSFLLWNASNGQRHTSDELNSPTISSVLTIHTGLHIQRYANLASFTHMGPAGWTARALDAPNGFPAQGRRLKRPWMVAKCGRLLTVTALEVPYHLTVPAVDLEGTINIFRAVNRTFSSSANLAVFIASV